LFDLDGKLVGIHSRVGLRLPENMHVPMREFLNHWEAMERGDFVGEGPFAQKGEPGTGFLGIVGEAAEGGLQVERVAEDSPASKAGIQPGDLITSINDRPVPDRDALRAMLAEMASGDRMTLELRRPDSEEPLTLNLRLGER
jgi:serine protease Do